MQMATRKAKPTVAAMAAAGNANNDGAQISNSANTICCHYKAPGLLVR